MMGAVISSCGNFRYLLTRQPTQLFPSGSAALFIMLNPSTADATTDDHTIRKCVGFATAWGVPGIVVANLYAYRATDPRDLKRAGFPVGPDNDQWIRRIACRQKTVVCAWGNHAQSQRVDEVVELLASLGVKTTCLGTNKNGSPKHPLMVPYSQPLVEFNWP